MTVNPLRLLRTAWRWEVTMWRSLYRWTFRRPLDLPPGARAFGYTRAIAAVLWGFVAVSALEIPMLHLLLPWPTAQAISLVVGLWGLVWMIGMLASLKINPHVLGDDGLRLRNGARLDLPVDWSAVADVRGTYRNVPAGAAGTVVGGVLHLGVGGQTTVDLVLREPTAFRLPKGTVEAREIRINADDPQALVAAAREHLRVADSH